MKECILVDIDQLVLGRALPCPIHDQKGTLLLAEGEVLTSDHKRRIKERGATKAVIPEEHASRMTLLVNDPEELEKYERELDQVVDKAIQTGRFSVQNHGPSVSERVVDRGCENYSAAHVEAVNDHIADGKELVAQNASSNFEISPTMANRLQRFAACSTDLLASDFGGTLSIALANHKKTGLTDHALAMATLGMAIAIELEFDADNVEVVGLGGLLADIGMAQVPEELREAKRRLTANEFAKVQRHAIYTANMVERLPKIPDLVRLIVYQVHERPDGSGYPRGRVGNTIHPFASILHVADTYIAMTTARPHRPPMMPYAAMKQLLVMTQRRQIDSQAARAILHVLSLFPIGSYVALSDGSVGKVMRSNKQDYTNPIVARLQDANGERLDLDSDSLLVDLSDSDLSVAQALPQPGSAEVRLEGAEAESTLDHCYALSLN